MLCTEFTNVPGFTAYDVLRSCPVMAAMLRESGIVVTSQAVIGSCCLGKPKARQRGTASATEIKAAYAR